MNRDLILLPMLAMVFLTAVVWGRLYCTRMREIRGRHISPQQLASRAGGAAALANVAGPSDNFMNLFELPVLFYVLTTLLYVMNLADPLYLWLAVLYASLRGLHSLIHVTYNRVAHRFLAYALSSVVLWAMWGRFSVQLVERLHT